MHRSSFTQGSRWARSCSGKIRFRVSKHNTNLRFFFGKIWKHVAYCFSLGWLHHADVWFLRHCTEPQLSTSIDKVKVGIFKLYGFSAVVLNLFHTFYPFIKQDYQIYPQYTQWCSFLKITKLANSYSLEWFAKMYICCNLRFSKFTPLDNSIRTTEGVLELQPITCCTPNTTWASGATSSHSPNCFSKLRIGT